MKIFTCILSKHGKKVSLIIGISFLTMLTSYAATKKALSDFAYIPANCNVIGKIEFGNFLKINDLAKKLNLAEFKSELKTINDSQLKPQDIKNIYFGAVSKENSNKSDGVAIIETSTDISIKNLLEKAMKNKKVKEEKIRDLVVYTLPQGNNNSSFDTAVQINPTTIAFGSRDVIFKTLDLLDGKGKSVLSDNSFEVFRSQEDVDTLVWIAGKLNGKKYDLGGKHAAISNVFIKLDYDKKFEINGTIECVDETDSQNLIGPLKMLAAIVTMNPKSGLTANDIKIDQKGAVVLLNITIPKIAFDKYINSVDNNKSS